MIFSETEDTLYCSLSGKLDGQVCSTIEPELLHRVTHFKNDRQNSHLIFDLAGAHYISSSFLRICLIHCKLLGKNNFEIINVSEDIHKVFHISGFSEIINVSRC